MLFQSSVFSKAQKLFVNLFLWLFTAPFWRIAERKFRLKATIDPITSLTVTLARTAVPLVHPSFLTTPALVDPHASHWVSSATPNYMCIETVPSPAKLAGSSCISVSTLRVLYTHSPLPQAAVVTPTNHQCHHGHYLQLRWCIVKHHHPLLCPSVTMCTSGPLGSTLSYRFPTSFPIFASTHCP